MNAVTPLHNAAKHGNLEIMQLLFSHDAVANTLDDQGDSPFHGAENIEGMSCVYLPPLAAVACICISDAIHDSES